MRGEVPLDDGPDVPAEPLSDDRPTVTQTVHASGSSTVVVAGRDVIVTGGQSGPTAPWPVRVGLPPPVADHYQHREVERRVADVVTSRLDDSVCGVVLSGLGGVGKSQLAASRAWAVWRDKSVDLALWISAVTRAAIVAAYAEAAASALVDSDPAIGARTADEAARKLRTWLGSTDRRWLIVLDDVRETADLEGLWPPNNPAGRTVITTRRRDALLARLDRPVVPVGSFSETEAGRYLAGKLPGHAATPDGRDGLHALAADLGHLPLALAQAAAFITDNPLLTVSAYRERLADRRRTLAQVLPRNGELPDEHHATVTVTWSLSVERADRRDPEGVARPLLALTSVLDPAGVPTAFFTSAPSLGHVTDAVGREVDTDAVVDTLGNLHRLSLITLDTSQPARTVQVHALVQRAVRDALTPDDHARVAQAAADGLLAIWPPTDVDTALTQALRSCTTVLHATSAPELWRTRVHRLLFRAGRSYGEAGLVTAAVEHFRDLHDQAHRHLGPDHTGSLATRNHLGHWLAEAGDHAAAIAEHERLLEYCLRVLGPDHPNTLTTRNNLIMWRAEGGDPANAVAELEALLADRLRVLGPDHIDTLICRHNLACKRADAGDHVAAAAELELLLADRVRVLGPDHPDTRLTRNNLAAYRAESGDRDDAVHVFDRLVGEMAETVGPHHLDALVARNNLARWRAESGDHAGAIAEFEQLLADQTRTLGADHPNTLTTRANLATCRAESGDLARAAAEFERLVADRRQVLGPGHTDTLMTRNNLAVVRARSGDHETALAELQLLLVKFTEVLGARHPETLMIDHNIATCHAQAGDHTTAISRLDRVLAEHIAVLGPDHPDTAAVRENLDHIRELARAAEPTAREPGR
ncbi:FxSxx-COOH system tetratricopeptide repeat protein [Saccharothrix hoggarensis]|uniref:FxSxx-COOH system tetratricopeptide repeat protein n=1 Tax=Saccharothrix hoggarensis TaxID=913853 RepID=A0ABW3R006_9PSEU